MCYELMKTPCRKRRGEAFSKLRFPLEKGDKCRIYSQRSHRLLCFLVQQTTSPKNTPQMKQQRAIREKRASAHGKTKSTTLQETAFVSRFANSALHGFLALETRAVLVLRHHSHNAHLRLGANPHANGGLLLRDLKLPRLPRLPRSPIAGNTIPTVGFRADSKNCPKTSGTEPLPFH